MHAHRHGVGQGEEQHHEHTPVIKKVKEKVKKIKEKIKKHGHDNEDEHGEPHSYTTEEDCDDEEVQVDPAANGAHPHLHESVGAKNLVGGRDGNLGGQGKVSLGEDTAKTTADQDPSMPKRDKSALLYPSVAEEQRGKQSHDVVNLGKTEGRVEDDPAAPPKVRNGTAATAATDQVDPAAHGAHPRLRESEGAKNSVGGRDENLGGQGKVSPGEVMAKTTADQDSSMPRWDQSTLLYPSVAEEQREKQSHDVVNLGKIEGRVEEEPAAPPKVRTGTAASATTDQFQPSHHSSVERTDNTTSPNVNLEAITGRVEEDPVWGATAEHHTPTYPSATGRRDDVGESPILTSFKDMAISDKPKSTESTQSTLEKRDEDQPMEESGQEQKSTSSYTEKLSTTATAVKDAAISAAVGSTEYGKKIAHTVYDTVSGVGSKGNTEGEIGQDEKVVGEADRGASIKEYVVGKLSPGEEDRALSEVLSDTVNTKKQAVVGTRSEEGSGGKGMVEKIKGAVGSWIGAGSVPADTTGAPEISGGEKEPTYASAQKDLKQ